MHFSKYSEQLSFAASCSHLIKEICTISSCRSHQFILTAWMVFHIWCDIIYKSCRKQNKHISSIFTTSPVSKNNGKVSTN